MFKKVSIVLLTVLLALVFSYPVFASTYIDDTIKMVPTELSALFDKEGIPKDKQEILYTKYKAHELPDVFNPQRQSMIPAQFFASDDYKKFIFPDGSYLKVSVEKSIKIPLTVENKQKLISLSRDEAYINHLYSMNNQGDVMKPLIVIFQTSWIEGISGFVNARYYQEELLDMSYSQSRITYVDSDSLDVNVYGGTFNILVLPKVDVYQQSGSTPARSYAKFSATIAGYITNTFTLAGYVRDTSVWAEFTHY